MKGKGRVRHMLDVNKILHEDIERAALGPSLTRVTEMKNARKRLNELKAQWTGDIDNVYRIFVGSTVEVVCLGMASVDDRCLEGVYATTDELPAWMQERIAVLSMMKVNPPQTKVEGIGMRVDESVYWVLKGA
jgi:hypothetical protein